MITAKISMLRVLLTRVDSENHSRQQFSESAGQWKGAEFCE